MNGTTDLLLGVIALAVGVMAIIQVAAVIAGLRVAKRVDHISREIESGIKPLLTNLSTLSADAARAANLAAAQVERFDKAFTDLAARTEQTLSAAQRVVATPARDGLALVTGVRAAFAAFQSLRESSRRRSAARAVDLREDEESLFIG